MLFLRQNEIPELGYGCACGYKNDRYQCARGNFGLLLPSFFFARPRRFEEVRKICDNWTEETTLFFPISLLLLAKMTRQLQRAREECKICKKPFRYMHTVCFKMIFEKSNVISLSFRQLVLSNARKEKRKSFDIRALECAAPRGCASKYFLVSSLHSR